jgi:uncharacterized protein
MNTALIVKHSKGKGRGVFAGQNIPKDAIIEECPLLVFPGEDFDRITSSHLVDYFFNFNKEEHIMALALGFGSLYNHAIQPNAYYELDTESRIITVYALGAIKSGEEICINYGGKPGEEFREWFDARNIELKQ